MGGVTPTMDAETDADATVGGQAESKSIDLATRQAAQLLGLGAAGGLIASVLSLLRLKGLGSIPLPTREDDEMQEPSSEREVQDLQPVLDVIDAIQKAFEELRSQQEEHHALQEASLERIEASLTLLLLEKELGGRDSLSDRLREAFSFIGESTFNAAFELLVQHYTKILWSNVAERRRASDVASPTEPGAHFGQQDAERYRKSLNGWRDRALEKLSNGESPSFRSTSPILPAEIKDEVQRRLEAVETEDGVNEAFDEVIAHYALSGPNKAE